MDPSQDSGSSSGARGPPARWGPRRANPGGVAAQGSSGAAVGPLVHEPGTGDLYQPGLARESHEPEPQPDPAAPPAHVQPGSVAAAVLPQRTLPAGSFAAWLRELGVSADVASRAAVVGLTAREALGLLLELGGDELAALSLVSDATADLGDVAGSAGPPGGAPRLVAAAGGEPSPAAALEIRNPWNQFQHQAAGAGHSRREMAALYRAERDEAPRAPGASTDATAGAAGTSPRVQPLAGAVLDMGYVVIRLPSHLNHLRGHHQCIWAVLLARLGVTHAQWAATQSQYYMPRFRGQAVMEASWVQQGLRLPVPVGPGERGGRRR